MREAALGILLGAALGVLYLAVCPPPARWEPVPYAAELAAADHHIQVDTGSWP